MPLAMLHPSTPFMYLRRMADIDDHWNITVIYDAFLDDVTAASLTVCSAAYTAIIHINPRFVFTAAAMARAIMHELYELLMYNLWLIFKQTRHDSEAEYLFRAERDRLIEQHLDRMPFWTKHDLPVLSAGSGGTYVHLIGRA